MTTQAIAISPAGAAKTLYLRVSNDYYEDDPLLAPYAEAMRVWEARGTMGIVDAALDCARDAAQQGVSGNMERWNMFDSYWERLPHRVIDYGDALDIADRAYDLWLASGRSEDDRERIEGTLADEIQETWTLHWGRPGECGRQCPALIEVSIAPDGDHRICGGQDPGADPSIPASDFRWPPDDFEDERDQEDEDDDETGVGSEPCDPDRF